MILLRHLRPYLIRGYCYLDAHRFWQVVPQIGAMLLTYSAARNTRICSGQSLFRQPWTRTPFIKLLSSNGTTRIGVWAVADQFSQGIKIGRGKRPPAHPYHEQSGAFN